MADGLCTGEQLAVIETAVHQKQRSIADDHGADAAPLDVCVEEFYNDGSASSVDLYENLCGRLVAAEEGSCNSLPSTDTESSRGASGQCHQQVDRGDSDTPTGRSNNNNSIVVVGAKSGVIGRSATNQEAVPGVLISTTCTVVQKAKAGTERQKRHNDVDVDITLDINMPVSPAADDDCRKKRCVDRYDSSESSDSGVAILSCTDCSGSSTASSDITDPGSPFSTASTHSEDSGNSNQPTKMPPTQNVHHPPWPWVSEETPPSSKAVQKTGAAVAAIVQKEVAKTTPSKQRQAVKRKETSSSSNHSNNITQKCLNNNLPTSNRNAQTTPAAAAAATNEPSPKKKPAMNNNNNSSSNNNNVSGCNTSNNQQLSSNVSNMTILPATLANSELIVNGMENSKTFPKLQQGKITEYFKAQYKSSTILKKELSNIMIKTIANPNSKFGNKKLADIVQPKRAIPRLSRTPQPNADKPQVKAQRSVPRKILPAPSKQPDNNIISMGQITTNNFPPIITTLIPNVYTIQQSPQTKPTTLSTKSTDSGTAGNIYMPQFTLNDKLNAIPIVTTRSAAPLGIIQPLQKVATINNFVKLNAPASMMPAILKLNTNFHTTPSSSSTATTPHHQQHHPHNIINTAVPTVTVSSLGKPVNSCTNDARLVTASHHQHATSNLVLETQHSNSKQCEERLHEASNDDSKSMELDVVEETRTQCPEELSPADSGVSSNLEVHINDEDLVKVKAQKSPILSQPKTIRFPAKERVQTPPKKLPVSADTVVCQWDLCAAQFDANGALLEHLQVKHVISQATQEQYVCLWQGCKVHGRKSCSRSWLERHVLAHAGSKPFRCIVDGCGQRFNSQLALERHVNGHFNTDGTQSNNAKKSVENPSVKLFKRNGKKIRFRRQPWSARMFDFIDSGMMEGLQYRLLTMTETRTNGNFDSTDDGQTVTLSSQVMAKRTELDGTRKLLLRWHPSDIVDDEWIPEKEYKKTKTVQIPRLQPNAKDNLRPILFPRSFNYCNGSDSTTNTSNNNTTSTTCSTSSTGRQKHRRKPLRAST